MPFTISHIAAALPTANKKSKLFFPAVAVGTMAPDFEYFLRTKMLGIYGHTTIGVFVLDLPLIVLIYLLVYFLIVPTLMPYLPKILQFKKNVQPLKTLSFWVRFCISALLGIFSHILWDSFTHATGFMVNHLPLLRENLDLLGIELPIYKILQYGSGVVGLLIIFCYLLCYQHKNETIVASVPTKQKTTIWAITIFLAVIVFILWCIAFPVSIKQYGTLAIRLIDTGCFAVIILTMFLKFTIKKA